MCYRGNGHTYIWSLWGDVCVSGVKKLKNKRFFGRDGLWGDRPNDPCQKTLRAALWTIVVTLAGTAQYPWVLRQSRYCGYCRWVLQGTVGTAGTAGTAQYPWVLQGTVGTARAKVTVGYCGSTRGYCRVL